MMMRTKPKLSDIFVIEVILLTILVVFALLLDTMFALSLFWQFLLFMAFLALLIMMPVFLSRQRKQAVWLLLTFGLALFGLQRIELNPRKPFIRFGHEIRNGMAIDEVQALLNEQFPDDGKFHRPAWKVGDGSPVTPFDNEPKLAALPDQSLHYTLAPDDGRYNSEWLIVYFRDGRVVGSEYLPD